MKKQTQLQQAKAYMDANPNATPRQMAKALKMPIVHVYNLRSKLKNGSKVVSTPTNNAGNGSILAAHKRQIDALQQQVTQLNSWNAQWEVRCNATDKELTECKIAYLDATAIIRYLERKIADLVKMGDK